MALFNYATKEITLKIVYYGPGLSGKTTNLQHLHAVLNPATKGKLLSLSTEADRTLFFDFLPVELGKIKEFAIRFQLYTVPGQVRYNATRRVVLKGADAVVFVADSQKAMQNQNRESFENMRENLRANNLNPDAIPVLLQYNKRDLDQILSVDELNAELNPQSAYEFIEAVAVSGAGVEETFKQITRMLIKDLSRKHRIEIQAPPPRVEPAPATAPLRIEPVAEPEPEPPVRAKAPASPIAAAFEFPGEETAEEAVEVLDVQEPEEAAEQSIVGEEIPEIDIPAQFEVGPDEIALAEDVIELVDEEEAIQETVPVYGEEEGPVSHPEPVSSALTSPVREASSLFDDIPPVMEQPAIEIPAPAAEIRVTEARAAAVDREALAGLQGAVQKLEEQMVKVTALLDRIASGTSESRSGIAGIKSELSALQLAIRDMKQPREPEEPKPVTLDPALVKDLKVLKMEQQALITEVRELQDTLTGLKEKKSWFKF